MYQAQMALLMLALAGVFAVEIRWPHLSKGARRALGVSLLIFMPLNWWLDIRLPIGRDLGFAINTGCDLLLLVACVLLIMRRAPPYRETTPKP